MAGKFFPNRKILQILRFRALGNGNLGPTLPESCPHLPRDKAFSLWQSRCPRQYVSQPFAEIASLALLLREKKNVYQYQSPRFVLKRPCNGEKMASTHEFAFFRCRSMRTGGVQNQAENFPKKALQPVPVPKSTFPACCFFSSYKVILVSQFPLKTQCYPKKAHLGCLGEK